MRSTSSAKSIVFATGGSGRMYKTTSNAHTLTGDGMGIIFRKGLPLEDMEFHQFHPTGLARPGHPHLEAVRGEGGILRNVDGERFMERYAPTIKDLAPRDIVARSMVLEVLGRGAAPNKDYVYHRRDTPRRDVLNESCPTSPSSRAPTSASDLVTEYVPVYPTCHYVMGGIPTKINGQVRNNDEVVHGLFAAGECACVGARRQSPGTNSLLDINVFGRRAGIAAAEYAATAEFVLLPEAPDGHGRRVARRVLSEHGNETCRRHPQELQQLMDDNASVFRTEETLTRALEACVRSNSATSMSACTTRANASTPTSSKPSSSASSWKWPRSPSSVRSIARNRAVVTPARTTRSAMT